MTVRQVEVLQWIGEGCPDGVWADFTYKTTAYALASRGLVMVDRRRNQWLATLTEDGRFYLDHGHYPTDSAAAHAPRPAAGADISAFAAELLNRLTAGAGQVTIESPSDSQRARYRRAIHHLITNRQIPPGHLLRHTGRDHGDLSIRLMREADAPKPEPVPKVEVPQVGAEVSDEVRALVHRMQLAVTEPTMERALQILQSIANECAKRGWSLEVDSRDDRRLQISTTECSFDVVLREELVDAELPDGDTLAAAKYPWQRVPLHTTKIGSGRLTLQLG